MILLAALAAAEHPEGYSTGEIIAIIISFSLLCLLGGYWLVGELSKVEEDEDHAARPRPPKLEPPRRKRLETALETIKTELADEQKKLEKDCPEYRAVKSGLEHADDIAAAVGIAVAAA